VILADAAVFGVFASDPAHPAWERIRDVGDVVREAVLVDEGDMHGGVLRRAG
jgi:hypothetical protein